MATRTGFVILEATCAECGNALSYQWVMATSYKLVKSELVATRQYCLQCAVQITEVSRILELQHMPHELQDVTDKLDFSHRTAPSTITRYRKAIHAWCVANIGLFRRD